MAEIYELNSVRYRMTLALRPQGIQFVSIFRHMFLLLGVSWLFIHGDRIVKAQDPTVKTIAPSGEDWNYRIRSWQSQDGLPEETVQAIAQTNDGYLWLGTTAGLLRFDGEHFRLFNHENTPALAEDNVFCLLAARDGRLLIGTVGGGVIEWRDGAFQSYPIGEDLATNTVRGLAEGPKGLIWVATSGGLFWIRDGRIERADRLLGLPNSSFDAALEDHTGRAWVGGKRLFAMKNGRVHEYLFFGLDSRNHVKSLFESSDGAIWVGTVVGLYRLQPSHDRFEPVPGVFGTIRALRELPNAEVWAGATSGGIFRVAGQRVTRLQAPSPLISNTVYSIFTDSERNLWIGTLAGVMRLSRTSAHILALPEAVRSDFGTVSLDADDSLWGAANQLVHIRGGIVSPIKFPALGNIRIRTVIRARDGSLWIGSIGAGVYRISAQGTKHMTTHEGLSTDFVQALLEGRDGTMWIGCDNGLSLVNASDFKILKDRKSPQDITVRSLLEDRDGAIWVGTERGLWIYRNGETVHNALTTELRNEKIWALHQDAEGGMWIGTRGDGLYRYRDGRVSHFTTASGLTSDSIYSILEDKQNHFWLSTPSGVMLLNRGEFDAQAENPGGLISLSYYAASEGNTSVQVFGGMQPAGAITRTGEVWFPTSLGFWRIRPGELEHPLISNLKIDAITVDGKPEALAGRLNMNANSDRIEIAFGPVLLSTQEALRFRYKLDRFDRAWTYASAQQRLATYTNLPAGHYSFIVEAWQTDRPDHVVDASIEIVKRPHFYRTPWFVAMCALTVAMLIFFVYRMRMQQINSRFNAVLAERTRMAREMHDTLIQGCVGVSAMLEAALSDEIDDEESRLDMIELAATQIRATVDEARQEVVNLRGEERTPIDLNNALEHMAERTGVKYGVEVSYHLLGKPFSVSQQATHELMMVTRECVFNAILHGHAQEVGIEVAYQDDCLKLSVKDDGKGFDVSKVFSEEHFGLRGMRERIQQLGGKFEIQSTPGRGVHVHAEIPSLTLTP